MQTTPENFQRFLTVLTQMAVLCCDEISSERLQAYWVLLKEDFTIEEWEGVGIALMREQDFRRVPMPQLFLERLPTYQRENPVTMRRKVYLG